MLPVRLLKEYAYCPRYAYLQLFVKKDYVTESMRAAQRADTQLADLAPMGWRVERCVKVVSKRLGLWGYADALLIGGRLFKVVEVKALTPVSRRALRGGLRHVLAQAVAYGLCAEEMLRLALQGAIVVGSSGAVEERVTPALRRYVESLASGLRRMVVKQEDPGPLRGLRCGYCAFRDLCRAIG